MYKQIDKLQHSFLDFSQPMGLREKVKASIESGAEFAQSLEREGYGCIEKHTTKVFVCRNGGAL